LKGSLNREGIAFQLEEPNLISACIGLVPRNIDVVDDLIAFDA
jgi:hypothetical protein